MERQYSLVGIQCVPYHQLQNFRIPLVNDQIAAAKSQFSIKTKLHNTSDHIALQIRLCQASAFQLHCFDNT